MAAVGEGSRRVVGAGIRIRTRRTGIGVKMIRRIRMEMEARG
jgi:hypothetical protein